MAVHLTIQRLENLLCLFLYYPGRGCKRAFFSPWLHVVFIIPDEYFHKCKPLGRTGLKQNVKATSLWLNSDPPGPGFLPPPYQSQGRVHKIIQSKEHMSDQFKLPLS